MTAEEAIGLLFIICLSIVLAIIALDDRVYERHNNTECPACGSLLQEVRPGKFQCPECE